jgi:hypothetical protein
MTPRGWEIAEFGWGGDGEGDARAVLYSHRSPLDGIGKDERAAVLKQLGDEGWEPCVFTAPTTAYGAFFYVFKRPLP